MKRIAIIIIITFLLVTLHLQAFAHSGRTDENGGHNSASGYHYHHGYPAHSHAGGMCPYDYDDNTAHGNSHDGSGFVPSHDKEESETSRKENKYPFSSEVGSSNDSEEKSFFENPVLTFLWVIFALIVVLCVFILSAILPELIINFIFHIILNIPEDETYRIPMYLAYKTKMCDSQFENKKQLLQEYEDYLSFISDD